MFKALRMKKNNIKLRFIDSYKFLTSSLNELASFLDKDKRIVQHEFCNLSAENFDLLTQRCISIRVHWLCWKNEGNRGTIVRIILCSLTGDTVSETDYAHVINVWRRFSIRTLGEYSDLYLKTDVLLLDEIFENFRDSCIASYGLDPAYYYTLLLYRVLHGTR